MALNKIVSGGQTGVDRGALKAALAHGFPCGGWCPPGRAAEDGVIPPEYPMTEMAEGSYRQRTLRNVLDSDGTAVIYFGVLAGGTEQTMLFCIENRKPYKLIDGTEAPPERAAALLAQFVEENAIRVLNVAGPRLSCRPQAETYAERAIGLLLDRPEK